MFSDFCKNQIWTQVLFYKNYSMQSMQVMCLLCIFILVIFEFKMCSAFEMRCRLCLNTKGLIVFWQNDLVCCQFTWLFSLVSFLVYLSLTYAIANINNAVQFNFSIFYPTFYPTLFPQVRREHEFFSTFVTTFKINFRFHNYLFYVILCYMRTFQKIYYSTILPKHSSSQNTLSYLSTS